MNHPEQLPILYSFRRCPYAMRARIALVLCGCDIRLREIVLRDKPAEMLEVSPKGTVPVLILHDGTVVDESLTIMQWALSCGTKRLAQPTEEMMALLAENDGPFKVALDHYKYPTRYKDSDPLEHRAIGVCFIESLESRLSEHDNLFGADPSFADYAIFPFIRQFRIADQAWFDAQDWPRVHSWLTKHMESDVFVQVMKKFPLWKDTGKEFLFGETQARVYVTETTTEERGSGETLHTRLDPVSSSKEGPDG